MDIDGYRLRVAGLGGLSQAIQGFRADALRILARTYGGMVAEEAVRRLDLHRAGMEPRPADASPLADANGHLRRQYKGPSDDLNCEICLHVVGEAVLARFVRGGAAYRKAWEGRREVVPWGWAEGAERPRTVREGDWAARAQLWREAAGKPGLTAGLRMALVEGRLPSVGWGGVRRYLPGTDDRVRWLAEAICASSPGGGPEQEAHRLAEARRRAAATVNRELTRECLTAYGRTGGIARAPAPARKEPERLSGPVMIDHADVVEASDGRIFVAVPYAGLEADSRVFLQVGDDRLSIVQNGVQFGTVAGIPRLASDLLRDCKHATLVEVDASRERRLLRARHVAIVSDISLSEGIGRSLGRLRIRDAAARNREAEEVRLWDGERTGSGE